MTIQASVPTPDIFSVRRVLCAQPRYGFQTVALIVGAALPPVLANLLGSSRYTATI